MGLFSRGPERVMAKGTRTQGRIVAMRLGETVMSEVAFASAGTCSRSAFGAPQ